MGRKIIWQELDGIEHRIDYDWQIYGHLKCKEIRGEITKGTLRVSGYEQPPELTIPYNFSQKETILKTLQHTRYNRRIAASLLGIDINKLKKLINKHKIRHPSGRWVKLGPSRNLVLYNDRTI